MSSIRHILITVAPRDEAGVLAGDHLVGYPPRAHRHVCDTHGATEWRRGLHGLPFCVVDGYTTVCSGYAPSKAALPLLWNGQPAGALAVARALGVLARVEGVDASRGLAFTYDGEALMVSNHESFAVNGARYELIYNGRYTKDTNGCVPLDEPPDGEDMAQDLWALATVIAARVPGCGVEVVRG